MLKTTPMAAFGRAYPSHRNRLCRQLFWFSSPKCSLKPPGQKHNRNLEMLRSQLQPRTATASSSALPDQFVTVIMEKKHLNISLIALPWTQAPPELAHTAFAAPRPAFGPNWAAGWGQHWWHARTPLPSTRLLEVISFRHGRGRGIDCLGSSNKRFPRYLQQNRNKCLSQAKQ